jgi:hypothetical protein
MPMNEYMDSREFVHRIDGDDRISYVNAAWLAFGSENGWDTNGTQVLGSRLMAQVADPETRHIYRLLIDRTRESGRAARFVYRCDSPDCRRFMEMRIGRRMGREVEFRSRVLRLERRRPVALLDSALRERCRGVVTVCSWCKNVRTGGGWLEIEEAVQSRILADAPPPRISHGICPACSERMK